MHCKDQRVNVVRGERICVYYSYVLREQNATYLKPQSTHGLYTYRRGLNGEKQEYFTARSSCAVTRQTNMYGKSSRFLSRPDYW